MSSDNSFSVSLDLCVIALPETGVLCVCVCVCVCVCALAHSCTHAHMCKYI